MTRAFAQEVTAAGEYVAQAEAIYEEQAAEVAVSCSWWVEEAATAAVDLAGIADALVVFAGETVVEAVEAEIAGTVVVATAAVEELLLVRTHAGCISAGLAYTRSRSVVEEEDVVLVA